VAVAASLASSVSPNWVLSHLAPIKIMVCGRASAPGEPC
jgi:hypothetical protein